MRVTVETLTSGSAHPLRDWQTADSGAWSWRTRESALCKMMKHLNAMLPKTTSDDN